MEQQYAAFQPSSKATTEPVRSFSTNSRPALRAAARGGRPRAGDILTSGRAIAMRLGYLALILFRRPHSKSL
jgi:hypothetical protein